MFAFIPVTFVLDMAEENCYKHLKNFVRFYEQNCPAKMKHFANGKTVADFKWNMRTFFTSGQDERKNKQKVKKIASLGKTY